VCKLIFVQLNFWSRHLGFLTSSYLLAAYYHCYDTSGVSAHEYFGVELRTSFLASVEQEIYCAFKSFTVFIYNFWFWAAILAIPPPDLLKTCAHHEEGLPALLFFTLRPLPVQCSSSASTSKCKSEFAILCCLLIESVRNKHNNMLLLRPSTWLHSGERMNTSVFQVWNIFRLKQVENGKK